MQKTFLSAFFATRTTEVRTEVQPATTTPVGLSLSSLEQVSGGLAPNSTWAVAGQTEAPNSTW